jgi:hypothetical protein
MAKKTTLTDATSAANRVLTFIVNVSTAANAVHVYLNGKAIDLGQDGDTWSGKEPRAVGDHVDVNVTVNGFDGDDWTFALSVDCPDEPKKLLSKKGTVGQPGGHGFGKTVSLAATPCAS